MGYVGRVRFELPVYVQGDLIYAFVRPTRELTGAEAHELKRERLAKGWTDRPVMPD
jgi:hypothetical protein